MKTVIFGAQGYALGAYDALTTLYPEQEVECFLVSSLKGNASTLGGRPVVEVGPFSAGLTEEEKKDYLIYIATPDNVQGEIVSLLDGYGFSNYVKVDSDKWAELMEDFFKASGDLVPLASIPTGDKKPVINYYMAKFYKDKALKTSFELPKYVHPLQVGAALTDVRVSDLADCEGNNISHKNPNYCELTGLYWIWKNVLCDGGDEEYYGLCQYRRMFELSENDMGRLRKNDVDVVLPYPLPYEPNIHVHHERYIKDVDWKALWQALRELQPEYAEVFEKVLEQRYLFNYNVILAKKKVLRDYCEWLFPVLERTEDLSEPKGVDRADRYIGYMGETLETLYFMYHAKELNIVYTGCKMLV